MFHCISIESQRMRSPKLAYFSNTKERPKLLLTTVTNNYASFLLKTLGNYITFGKFWFREIHFAVLHNVLRMQQ